jgi:signal-transduction protein with cAMP-binding, CBS, and nucleotidyltransferase domain
LVDASRANLRKAGISRADVTVTLSCEGSATMDLTLRRPEEILAYRPLRQLLGREPWALWAVSSADSVLAALRIMADKNIGFLVVLKQGAIAGVLSERDCVRRVVLANKSPEITPVVDVMTRDVVTVDIDHAFADCLRLMHQHRVRHLPVVTNKKVIAVVSVRDLLSEAVKHHEKIITELERERLTIFTSTA